MAGRGTYANTTNVTSEGSRAEIERTLRRYGATAFGYAWDDDIGASIMFRITNRQIRFTIPMPSRKEFALTPSKRLQRSDAAVDAAFEQAVRQRWRALALVIKAKLEAVDAGISTIEQEFLAHIVLPNKQSVYDWVRGGIEEIYATGEMRSLPAGVS